MSKRLNPRRRKYADAAREVLVELLADSDRPRLVVEDEAAARALNAKHWSRYSRGDSVGRPWPEPGEYAEACVRLLKSKPALELAIHATASVLEPGATLWLYGANDEGIRSAPKRLGGLFEVVGNTAKKHSRVFEARRTPVAPKTPLDAWRETSPVEAGWVSYPGVFARGSLDAGTAALLGALPEVDGGARVLDFACGIGVIAGWLHARHPDAHYDLLDSDSIALLAAGENVPAGATYLSDGWHSAPPTRYDLIVSNPPFHDGKDEDFTVLRGLIAGAPRALRAHGTLWLVCQRQVPVGALFQGSLLRATAVSTDARYTVWKAHR